MTRTADFRDRIAVVTGGAQGIGLAVVRTLIARGARVAIWDMNPARALSEMEGVNDGDFQVIDCNVADWDSVKAAAERTLQGFGRIDALVNSAGVAGPNRTVQDYDNGDWADIVQINLTGTYFVNKAVIGAMKDRNYGRIVNIASIAGKEGNPNACAYSASKAGVIGFTKTLGKELAEFDIAVNCVTPAAARTPIFDQMSQQHIDYMLSKIPRNRFLEVDEAANMIAWLASAENSFSTGAVFDLSGGRATY
ncbi:SDR family NAD(P)-dependent oxidoreductase [Sedimentitalea sp. JM2-8]|uniref:SDR family NAD(P)-dependent oxidoreductase n=1 Tax=Sedimentitalea xiamensis TaxID=3050037 RepID=A0ABT7FCR6_9RHOB|nr:SDR family NAD(P)-dependent oxidoreductase [Sedimentitalea xiamensis]MDK3072614.1 SDR family NAD(P)-dependent oxidoreductase [Sedimentitalea xiamensis]